MSRSLTTIYDTVQKVAAGKVSVIHCQKMFTGPRWREEGGVCSPGNVFKEVSLEL